MNRYKFPLPFDLPETVCNPYHIQYLFIRAAKGRHKCYVVLQKLLNCKEVYRYELTARKR